MKGRQNSSGHPKPDFRPNKVPYDIPFPNNMGVIRYILALAVIVEHFNILTGGDIYFPFTSYQAVGGFFTLSGFLIYGSYLKKRKFLPYITSRMIRLLPAYFFVVLAFAVGLVGVSSLPPGEYFINSGFWKYLAANLSFMNFLQPSLPGVFEGFEVPAINGSLWTLKVEWMLYLSVPLAVWIIGKFRNRATLTFVIIFVVSVSYGIFFRYLYVETGKQIYEILGRQMFGQLSFFYCGVMVYKWFDVFMRYRWYLIAVAAAWFLVTTHGDYLAILFDPIAFTILVIGFSMIGKWGTWEGKHDNVSYNMYLVHFPVCQLVAYFGLMPFLGQWECFAIVIAVTFAISVIMNHFIEKPVQKAAKKWLKSRPTKGKPRLKAV